MGLSHRVDDSTLDSDIKAPSGFADPREAAQGPGGRCELGSLAISPPHPPGSQVAGQCPRGLEGPRWSPMCELCGNHVG